MPGDSVMQYQELSPCESADVEAALEVSWPVFCVAPS